MHKLISLLALLLGWTTLWSEEEDERFPPYDNTTEVDAYYKANPEFFVFKTPADLPEDLQWDDGMQWPEFSDPEARKGGTLHFFLPSFPPSLRTVGPNSNSSFRSEHWDDIGIAQVSVHPNVEGAYVPGLANQWATSADRTTCYYKLDPEARFSNGDPVKVDDFLMMFYIMHSPYIKDPWYNNHYKKKYKSIIKYDDLTFAIVLPEPRADPLYWSGMVPYNAKFFRAFGPDFAQRYNWKAYPTTGAYELDTETMLKGRKINLRRVKNWFLKDRKYYRNRFNPDVINYSVIGDLEKAFKAFRKGVIDWFPLDNPIYWNDKMDIPEFHKGYIVKSKFYNDYPRPPYGIYINCAQPRLDDLRIRVGIQHAFNVQKVIDVDIRGEFDRLNTTSEGYGRFSAKDIKAREFSVEKARAAFASAGYTQAGSDGVLVNAAGERLSFELTTRDDPVRRRYALRFKEEALKAGLEIRIEALDSTSAFKKIRDKKHELTYTAWSSTPPYPRYWEGFHSDNAYEKREGVYELDVNGRRKAKPNTNNITSTANEALDKLIDEYEKAQTVEQVETLAHACDHIIFDEASYVPCWAPNFFRTGYWRWIRWPKDFNVRVSELAVTNHVLWIDEEERERTMKAKRSGQTFPSQELIFDQYRAKQP